VKITVLGAGVIGLTTAYYLVKKGHEVTVIDSKDQAGAGSSYANGGQLSYSFSDPLGKPSLLKKLPSIFFNRDSALQLSHPLNLSTLKWGMKFLKECTKQNHKKNSLDLLDLSTKSKFLLEALEQDIKEDFLHKKSSKIVIFENKDSLKNEVNFLPEKTKNGSDSIFLSASEILNIEPALESFNISPKGALFSKQDETGNPLLFCNSLVNWLKKNGAELIFNREVKAIEYKGNTVKGYLANDEFYEANKIVICLGALTEKIINTGLSIIPVRGYSLTLDPGSVSFSRSITLTDRRMLFTKLGKKIRITGFADFYGNRVDNQDKRCNDLLELSKEVAPLLADYKSSDIDSWVGYRPLTPSGIPVIGPCSKKGLFINSGHGFYGWTLACSSGKKLADYF